MAQSFINNRFIASSINNNYKFLFFGLILILYFVWMDIALFVNLQRWSPPPIEETSNSISHSNNFDIIDNEKKIEFNNNSINKADYSKVNTLYKDNRVKIYNHADPFSIFKPLSVKLIMIDHVTHYIHDILARFLADTLHFTRIFPWVTANLVSFAGLGAALVGCKLTLSDKLFYRQIGALLFEARNLADSLDGVVFRSRKRDLEKLNTQGGNNNPQIGVYQSNYGTLGYNVDVICDGLAGLAFVLAIFIRFLKHPPHKYSSSKLLLNSCKLENQYHNHTHHSNNSNYNNHKLENEKQNFYNKYECIQMNRDNDENINTNEYSEDNQKLIIDTNTASIAAAAFASNDSDNNGTYNLNSRHFSSRQVKLVVVSFGIRLLFTGLIWDHYVHKYHDLLMVFSNNPTQRRMQGQAFKSIGMWLIMWFWRIGNACSILEHLVITTFFDKLWEYLVFTSYIGWAYLVILTLFTQIHYTELYESLNTFAAFT